MSKGTSSFFLHHVNRISHHVNKVHQVRRSVAQIAAETKAKLKEMTPQQKAQWIVSSLPFQLFIAFIILTNALVIGLETDIPDFEYWYEIENIFLFVFTLDLLLNLFIDPRAFFDRRNSDFIWNMFDFGVVCLGLFDSLASAVSSTGVQGQGYATLFRMVRLLRILRIFKIIRFLKQLYLLAYGFVEAAQAVFWVSMLMVFVLYVCSIVLVRTVGSLPESDEHQPFLHEQYGSIITSMLTLFEMMSSPNMIAYHGMRESKPILTVFLIAFIVFGSFGMIALLTGVISESMFEKNSLRLESERLERESKRKMLVHELQVLFESFQDEYGEASIVDVFERLTEVEEFLASKGIDYSRQDLEQCVPLMDADDNGSISNSEFVHGILSVAEEIRPMSIAELYHSVSIAVSKLRKIEDQFDKLLVDAAEARCPSQFLAKPKEGVSHDLLGPLLALGKQVNSIHRAQEQASADSKLILQAVQDMGDTKQSQRHNCMKTDCNNASTWTGPVGGSASISHVSADVRSELNRLDGQISESLVTCLASMEVDDFFSQHMEAHSNSSKTFGANGSADTYASPAMVMAAAPYMQGRDAEGSTVQGMTQMQVSERANATRVVKTSMLPRHDPTNANSRQREGSFASQSIVNAESINSETALTRIEAALAATSQSQAPAHTLTESHRIRHGEADITMLAGIAAVPVD
jgi:voltage-gated sodium channel